MPQKLFFDHTTRPTAEGCCLLLERAGTVHALVGVGGAVLALVGELADSMGATTSIPGEARTQAALACLLAGLGRLLARFARLLDRLLQADARLQRFVPLKTRGLGRLPPCRPPEGPAMPL